MMVINEILESDKDKGSKSLIKKTAYQTRETTPCCEEATFFNCLGEIILLSIFFGVVLLIYLTNLLGRCFKN